MKKKELSYSKHLDKAIFILYIQEGLTKKIDAENHKYIYKDDKIRKKMKILIKSI